MFRSENIKFIFLLLIFCWVMGPVLNALGLEDTKYSTLFGGLALSMSSILFVVSVPCWICDELDERAFKKLFGEQHYHWIWTFVLIPCIVYAFVYNYYAYMISCFITFIMLEIYRTVQNKHADVYRDIRIRNELRNQEKPKVVIK